MRRLVQRSVLVLASLALIACGGAKSKGGGEEKSNYQQLASMSADIDTSINNLLAPVDGVDAIATSLEELPTKYKITPDEARELVRSTLTGAAPALPASLDDAGKAELTKFLGDLANFKNSLVATPDNALAFGETLAKSLVEIPTLVAGVSADVALVKGNPLASKEDKAKAEKEEAEVKTLQDQLTTKIKDSQTKVMEIPGRAKDAIGKFTGALGKLGIDNVDAFMQAGQQTGADASNAATGAAANTANAATGAAEAAAEGAAEGAEKAAQDAANQ